MKKIKILSVFGTRPEVIKLAPFIQAVEADPDCISVTCATTQHQELQTNALQLFKIRVDHDLNIMKNAQDLFHITETILHCIKTVITTEKPDFIVIQGDTTTAFTAALSSFYCQIPVVHIEAGLRTNNLYKPYPEEANRTLISHIASLHMAPTQQAIENLAQDGITKNVHLVGNTIVDAVDWVMKSVPPNNNLIKQLMAAPSRKVIITVHRRENFGLPLREICSAISELSKKYSEYAFIWPVHPNPNIKPWIQQNMHGSPNLYLLDPLSYPDLIHGLNSCSFIMSDSGGIQEEALILGKPIVILRDATERPEIIESGYGVLAGANRAKILASCSDIIGNHNHPQPTNRAQTIYGKPGVATKILLKIKKYYKNG